MTGGLHFGMCSEEEMEEMGLLEVTASEVEMKRWREKILRGPVPRRPSRLYT